GTLGVEGDRLLAPVQPDEVAGLAAHGRVVSAGEVAGSRPLALDHPGPQVSQLPGGERHRDGLLQRDDRDAIERQCVHEPAGFRWISCRAITFRWISLVPSPTIISGASRK